MPMRKKNDCEAASRREEVRRRTRLRCGKVADKKGNFLVDCQIFDRSKKGARLRLAQSRQLPDLIRLFDDEFATLSFANVIWRHDNELGIEFPDGAEANIVDGKAHAALEGKYYAVK